MTPLSTSCTRFRRMPSPSNGAPDCRGCATSSQMFTFSPNNCVPIRLFKNDRSSRIACPPKSQNMKPTMSRTAAGSRITVYFPAGISRGRPESSAFCAAVSANASASRLRTSGEFAFCHPEESPASMVIEISAEVCWCQSLNPRELKMPSTNSELEKIPAVVNLCCSATRTMLLTPSALASGVIAAVSGKCREGGNFSESPKDCAAWASGMRNKSGSGC